jgi:hypothetical protein
MSRSRYLAAPATALLLALAAGPLPAQPPNTLIDAIGTLDYLHGPGSIQVGSWVKYHITARSKLGVTDDYTITVLIAGEEHWWGEDCFWVETWTQPAGQPVIPAATLMSYAIFDDSLAVPHTQLYQRKTVAGTRDDGSPLEQLFRRGNMAVKSRTPVGKGLTRKVDSLGTEVLKTAKGDLFCSKVRSEQALGTTGQSTDSSEYTETREVHVIYWTPQVPITHTAREEIELSHLRRAWLTGRSQESGPLRLLDRSQGVVELVDFATSGLTALLVPEARRHSLAEQRAAQAKAAAAGTPAPRAAAKPKPAGKPKPAAR